MSSSRGCNFNAPGGNRAAMERDINRFRAKNRLYPYHIRQGCVLFPHFLLLAAYRGYSAKRRMLDVPTSQFLFSPRVKCRKKETENETGKPQLRNFCRIN